MHKYFHILVLAGFSLGFVNSVCADLTFNDNAKNSVKTAQKPSQLPAKKNVSVTHYLPSVNLIRLLHQIKTPAAPTVSPETAIALVEKHRTQERNNASQKTKHLQNLLKRMELDLGTGVYLGVRSYQKEFHKTSRDLTISTQLGDTELGLTLTKPGIIMKMDVGGFDLSFRLSSKHSQSKSKPLALLAIRNSWD